MPVMEVATVHELPRATARCDHEQGVLGEASASISALTGSFAVGTSIKFAHASMRNPGLERNIKLPSTVRGGTTQSVSGESIICGRIESGEDVRDLRRFIGLSQTQFALALGISVHTLRNWEQGRRCPQGPALALLRVAARHPRVLHENLTPAR